ncbi:hypothetical protein Catovirus_1_281 [Catovirus CTV1]|uniref:Methyltransferase n=1 Tax=Catovirus CTV1 TaxID=1977631 RepID=A0A1V0S961_9VIRU|nr:hypothetical protein Catovirus_1_281 [Catovirus CTV1]
MQSILLKNTGFNVKVKKYDAECCLDRICIIPNLNGYQEIAIILPDELVIPDINAMLIFIKNLEKVFNDLKNNKKTFSLYNEKNQQIILNSQNYAHLDKYLFELKKKTLINYIKDTSFYPIYQCLLVDNIIVKDSDQGCYKSWDNICKLGVEWKNKTVLDIGCFNGYFSTKVYNEGCSNVIGVDIDNTVEKCYRVYCEINKVKHKFYKKDLGKDDISDVCQNKIDITLIFNCLHHIIKKNGKDDVEKNFLEPLTKKTKEFLFEVNQGEIEYIENILLRNNFVLIKKIESHRKTIFGDRMILYYKKL